MTSSGSGATPGATKSPTTTPDGAPSSLLATARLLTNAALAVLVAPRCASCNVVLEQPLDGPVCGLCWAAVRRVTPPGCHHCGQPLPSWRTLSLAAERCGACRRRPPAFDAGGVACDYDGELRAIVHAFKYERRRTLARPLGTLLRDAGQHVLRDADAVVPVPLHPWKRLQRGFNQSSDLAARLDVPVRRLLWRWRFTRPQAGLTPRQRRHNVSDAFAVAPWLSAAVRRRGIEGQLIVLVDDIMTTGATLDACARVLKRAGAREVRVLTLARALLRPNLSG